MMLRKILYASSVMVFVGMSMATQSVAAASGESGAARSTSDAATSNVTTNGTRGSHATAASAPLPSSLEVEARAYTLPEGIPHQTVHYNTATGNIATGTGGIAAGPTPAGSDDPVYVNEPPPTLVFPPGPGRLIADDLITVAVGGCSVSGYEFVVGRSANICSFTGQACDTAAECSGSQTCDPRPDPGFTAEFALYDGCPGLGGQIIPGTEGILTFADNALFTVLVDFGGANIPSESTLWLGIEFDKLGAGWVVGTPASTGFTENIYQHPNFPCFAKFAVFYSGFHARVFCDPDPPFEREFLAYFNPELNAPTFIPGGGTWIADDVTLIVDDCIMTSYEIASVGSVPYTVTAEIWNSCSAATVIEGTQGVFSSEGSGLPELARFSFPEGVPMLNGANYWVAWKYSNANTAAIIAGQATLGFNDITFALFPPNGCNFWFGPSPPNVYAGFNITVRCLGDAPTGACCDLTSAPAGDVPLCREVTQIACSSNLARYNQGAKCPNTCSIDGLACATDADCLLTCSLEGTSCLLDSDCPLGETCIDAAQTCLDLGVAFTPACGTAACCTPPASVFGETCVDLQRDECLAIPDGAGNSAVWQRGLFCNDSTQNCVRWVCRVSDTACDQAQPIGTVGCNNPNCCDRICDIDGFCCDFQWDQQCANRVEEPGGCDLPASNDVCFDPSPSLGALFVDVSTMRCGNNGNDCTTNDDCGPGTCLLPSVLMNTNGANATPDEQFCCIDGIGFGTVWAKFIAPASSMLITTVHSVGDADDAIIQVFSVGDNTTEQSACASLSPIGCDDDGGSPAGQARLSLRNLTVGATYYLMLAANGGVATGTYRVNFDTPTPDAPPPSNSSCSTPTAIGVGTSGVYDLTGALSDCPIELAQCLEIPTEQGQPPPPSPTHMINDVWFQLTAIGTGLVTVDTCEVAGPDTTMTIYHTDTCPPDPFDLVGCSNDAGGACGLDGLGSSISFNVVHLDSYMIRIGGIDGSEPAGVLKVSAVQADCQPNAIADVDEIACGAGNFCGGTCAVNGAPCGVNTDCPSGTCDGEFAGVEDCQGNGIPDACDGGCTSITIASSVPPSGEIDARYPTELNNAAVIFGWDSAVLTFDNDASAVAMGDFAVSSTSGVAPTVISAVPAGAVVTVTLSGPIPAGAWTTITYSPTGSSICLGFLPADVNGDGTASAGDILAVIDALNGVIPRPIYATDADRSGVAGAPDILGVIDLLNGASAFTPWINATLGASPCP